MISGRKFDDKNPLPRRFEQCEDLLTRSDWIASHPSMIKISTSGFVPEAPVITIEKYESVINELIAKNKSKEAFVLSMMVLCAHRYACSNPLSRWLAMSDPEIRDRIESFNYQKFGIITHFSPSLIDIKSEESVEKTLYLLHLLKWLVEQRPSDPNIAYLNALPLKEGNESSMIEPDESVWTKLTSTLFPQPKFLSLKDGVAHFFGKPLDAVIAKRPEEERKFITDALKTKAMQQAYQDMKTYYTQLDAAPRRAV